LSFALQTVAVCAVLFGGRAQTVEAGQPAATVRHIAVTGDGHDVDVKITASKPIAPRTQFVTDPDRLIVDLPEARPDPGLQKIAIHRGKLRDVRVGLLSENPPVTRVVLDLTSSPEFRVSPLANTIVVKLWDESGQDHAPAPIAPTTNPPAGIKPDETTTAASILPLETAYWAELGALDYAGSCHDDRLDDAGYCPRSEYSKQATPSRTLGREAFRGWDSRSVFPRQFEPATRRWSD
jgi:hypothetical protein